MELIFDGTFGLEEVNFGGSEKFSLHGCSLVHNRYNHQF